jgi:hypothetical protein
VDQELMTTLLEDAKKVASETRQAPQPWAKRFLVNPCPDCGAKTGQRCGFESGGSFVEMDCMLHEARVS